MKLKHIIIFILSIVVVATGLVFILNKDEWFFKNKKEEIIPGEKFSYTPVMYKICDDDNCNYLVGAMHLGDAHIKNLSDKVINAYKEMDALAVEVDTTNATIDISKYMLPDGKTLDTLLPESLNTKLEKFSEDHPSVFPYELYKSYKIGLLPEFIATGLYMELGYMTEGVDSYFLNLAHKENKKIIEIETMEPQESLLDAYSDELYIYQIEYTIDTYEEQKELIKKLYNAYLAGDAENIKEILNMEEESDETKISDKLKAELEKYKKDLYDDRNLVMASAIEDYLATNKNVFVTVGAAHVVADNGIVEILKEKGYKVIQMN